MNKKQTLTGIRIIMRVRHGVKHQTLSGKDDGARYKSYHLCQANSVMTSSNNAHAVHGLRSSSLLKGPVGVRNDLMLQVTSSAPAASSRVDCIHLCLHKDPRRQSTRCISAQSVDGSHAAVSVVALEEFCGIDIGFQLDREVHVMAVVCRKNVVLLALSSRATLDAWCHAIRRHLGCERQFTVDLVKAPPCVPRSSAPVQLFVRGSTLCLASRDSHGSGVPRYLASWTVRDFRRFGILDGKFCFEVANGDVPANGSAVYALSSCNVTEIDRLLRESSRGRSSSLSDAETVGLTVSRSFRFVSVLRSKETLVHTFPRRSPPGGTTLLDSSCIYAMLSFDKKDEVDETDHKSLPVASVADGCPVSLRQPNRINHYEAVPKSRLSRTVEEDTVRVVQNERNSSSKLNDAFISELSFSDMRNNKLNSPVFEKTLVPSLDCTFDVKPPGLAVHETLSSELTSKSDSVRRRYSCGDQLVATWWSLLGRAATFTDLKCLSRSLSQLCCSMASSAWTKRTSASTLYKPCFGLAAWHHHGNKPDSVADVSPECEDCINCQGVLNSRDDQLKSVTSIRANVCKSFPPSAVVHSRLRSPTLSDALPTTTTESVLKSDKCLKYSSVLVKSKVPADYRYCNYLDSDFLDSRSLDSTDHANVHCAHRLHSQCSSEDQDDDPAGSYITLKMVGLPQNQANSTARSSLSTIGDHHKKMPDEHKKEDDGSLLLNENNEDVSVFCEVNQPATKPMCSSRWKNRAPQEQSALSTYLDMTVGACSSSVSRKVSEKRFSTPNGYVPVEPPRSVPSSLPQNDLILTGPSVDAAVESEAANCYYVRNDLPYNVNCIPEENCIYSSCVIGQSFHSETTSVGKRCGPGLQERTKLEQPVEPVEQQSATKFDSFHRQVPFDDMLCIPKISAESCSLLVEERLLRRSSSVVESTSKSSRHHSSRLLRFICKGKLYPNGDKRNYTSAKDCVSVNTFESESPDLVNTKVPEILPRSMYAASNRLPSPNYPPPPLPEDGNVHLFASASPGFRSRADSNTFIESGRSPPKYTGKEPRRPSPSATGVYDDSNAYSSVTVPYANLMPYGNLPLSAHERSAVELQDSHTLCSESPKSRFNDHEILIRGKSSRIASASESTCSANTVESASLKSVISGGHCSADGSMRSAGSSAITTLRPRYGSEYQRVDRRRPVMDASGEDWSTSSTPQPSPYSVASSSVFTFDASSSGSEDVSTPTPFRQRFTGANEPSYVNLSPRTGSDSTAILLDAILPTTSRRCSSAGSGEVNYAQIDLSNVTRSPTVVRPVERAEPTAYAVIDLVATAAAARTGREHAWLRQDRLRRRSTRRSESSGVCRGLAGQNSLSLSRKCSVPSEWCDDSTVNVSSHAETLPGQETTY